MTPSEQAQEEKSHAQARRIFSTLANEDALRIFSLAANGIEASKSVLAEHHFSKKRYYVRLGELVDIGLVTKEKGVYKHTPFGQHSLRKPSCKYSAYTRQEGKFGNT